DPRACQRSSRPDQGRGQPALLSSRRRSRRLHHGSPQTVLTPPSHCGSGNGGCTMFEVFGAMKRGRTRLAESAATFDGVASEEVKKLRTDILAAADKALANAAKEAARGNAKGAGERLETSRVLYWQAINIPLEVIDREL